MRVKWALNAVRRLTMRLASSSMLRGYIDLSHFSLNQKNTRSRRHVIGSGARERPVQFALSFETILLCKDRKESQEEILAKSAYIQVKG